MQVLLHVYSQGIFIICNAFFKQVDHCKDFKEVTYTIWAHFVRENIFKKFDEKDIHLHALCK